MTHTTQITRRVAATDVAMLEDSLNSTLEEVIPDALVLTQGIRVTRVGPGNYLVETTANVPCGYTIFEQH